MFLCDGRKDTKLERKVLWILFAGTILKQKFLTLCLEQPESFADCICRHYFEAEVFDVFFTGCFSMFPGDELITKINQKN